MKIILNKTETRRSFRNLWFCFSPALNNNIIIVSNVYNYTVIGVFLREYWLFAALCNLKGCQ